MRINDNKTNIFLLVASFFLLVILTSCYPHKNSIWYYTLDNTLDNLQPSLENEIIPSYIDANNYRILKISNFNQNKIRNILIESKSTDVEIFHLPIIKNHQNKDILDLMIPLSEKYLQDLDVSKVQYFLIKFVSKKKGEDNITITFETDKKRTFFKVSKRIFAVDVRNSSKIDLNVFAYFDYNFLVKNAKETIIDDLQKHNSNVLVIPPRVIPDIMMIDQSSIKLDKYIEKTNDKFDYYILYLNWTDRNLNLKDPLFGNQIKKWFDLISESFKKNNISPKKIVIFPFDEPDHDRSRDLLTIKNIFRNAGINNPFYVSINNKDVGKTLVSKIEIMQFIPEILSEINTKNTISKIWTYQLTYGSRDRKPLEYRDISIKAFLLEAKGIGVWNYADVDLAIKQKGKDQFIGGKGTWQIDFDASSAEYSLIYRKKNEIFSSLRWEALSNGLEDYFWLELYRIKFGNNAAKKMAKKIMSSSPEEWQSVKLSLTK